MLFIQVPSVLTCLLKEASRFRIYWIWENLFLYLDNAAWQFNLWIGAVFEGLLVTFLALLCNKRITFSFHIGFSFPSCLKSDFVAWMISQKPCGKNSILFWTFKLDFFIRVKSDIEFPSPSATLIYFKFHMYSVPYSYVLYADNIIFCRFFNTIYLVQGLNNEKAQERLASLLKFKRGSKMIKQWRLKLLYTYIIFIYIYIVFLKIFEKIFLVQ